MTNMPTQSFTDKDDLLWWEGRKIIREKIETPRKGWELINDIKSRGNARIIGKNIDGVTNLFKLVQVGP